MNQQQQDHRIKRKAVKATGGGGLNAFTDANIRPRYKNLLTVIYTSHGERRLISIWC